MGVKIRQKVKAKGQSWWVFVSHQGHRKSKSFSTKKAALDFAKAVEVELAKGQFNMASNDRQMPTFEAYAFKWLESVEATRRASTHEEYHIILKNHLLPVFKDRPLDGISRGEIRDLLLSKLSNFSKARVCAIQAVISNIFTYALDDELIPSNPASRIMKQLKLGNDKKEIEPFNESELSLFLESCQSLMPEYYPFFHTMAKTGMRLGEGLALRWADIDFNSNYIWVRQSYRRGRTTKPKSGKTRKVDMSPMVTAVLKDLETRLKREKLERGLKEMPELVFDFDISTKQNYINTIFKRLLKKARLRGIRLHDLRHSYASILLSHGESPVYVKEQLGHSSIKITVDIYGHWIQTEKNSGVNRLDELTPERSSTAPCTQKVALTI